MSNQPSHEVELTSKTWKRITLMGVLCFMLGFTSCMLAPALGTENGGGALLSLCGMFDFAGVILIIVAKIGAWWTNG